MTCTDGLKSQTTRTGGERSSKHQNSSKPPAGAANAKTRPEKDAPGQ
nr:MAG TPA: hypothetical protein [Caudoviricetes sp.]